MKVEEIKGTITLADGTTSEFMLGRDLGWQQWGATTERLGQTGVVLDAMAEGLAEFLASDSDELEDRDALLSTWIIVTPNGFREWEAENETHAREQHEDAFKGDHPGEETILRAYKKEADE